MAHNPRANITIIISHGFNSWWKKLQTWLCFGISTGFRLIDYVFPVGPSRFDLCCWTLKKTTVYLPSNPSSKSPRDGKGIKVQYNCHLIVQFLPFLLGSFFWLIWSAMVGCFLISLSLSGWLTGPFIFLPFPSSLFLPKKFPFLSFLFKLSLWCFALWSYWVTVKYRIDQNGFIDDRQVSW